MENDKKKMKRHRLFLLEIKLISERSSTYTIAIMRLMLGMGLSIRYNISFIEIHNYTPISIQLSEMLPIDGPKAITRNYVISHFVIFSAFHLECVCIYKDSVRLASGSYKPVGGRRRGLGELPPGLDGEKGEVEGEWGGAM